MESNKPPIITDEPVSKRWGCCAAMPKAYPTQWLQFEKEAGRLTPGLSLTSSCELMHEPDFLVFKIDSRMIAFNEKFL